MYVEEWKEVITDQPPLPCCSLGGSLQVLGTPFPAAVSIRIPSLSQIFLGRAQQPMQILIKKKKKKRFPYLSKLEKFSPCTKRTSGGGGNMVRTDQFLYQFHCTAVGSNLTSGLVKIRATSVKPFPNEHLPSDTRIQPPQCGFESW